MPHDELIVVHTEEVISLVEGNKNSEFSRLTTKVWSKYSELKEDLLKFQEVF